MRVLVTGGVTGYLGQFVVNALQGSHEVVATVRKSTDVTSGHDGSRTDVVLCDLTERRLVEELFHKHGPFDAVINTAALSQPGRCHEDPLLARAINVPLPLLKALQGQLSNGPPALFVHISTDQVYSGSDKLSKEDATPAPVNEYGASKLAAERTIVAEWPHHIILRSSIIYGPQASNPVARPLFVQFIEQTLRSQTPRSFYEDEYRSPIFVGDITRLIAWILEGQASQTGASAGRSDPMAAALEARMKAISGLEVSVSHPWWPIPVGIYNLGGPDRLSRVDMVSAVASHLGLAMDCVQKASSASGKRDVPSPLDISMDSSKLQALLPFRLSKFCQGLKQVFPSS